MRTIKFRAWDIANKRMAPLWSIAWKAWDGQKDSFINYIEIERDGTEQVSEGEAILMQFTGLLDKNGKEIYEGDIIKTHFNAVVGKNGYSAYDEIGVVENHCNSFHATVIADKKHGCNYRVYSHSEVIGNIYANRNLVQP